MNFDKVDPKILKQALKEIILEDNTSFRGLLKEAIKEIISEQRLLQKESNEERRKRIEGYIDADFDAYDEVFKALVTRIK